MELCFGTANADLFDFDTAKGHQIGQLQKSRTRVKISPPRRFRRDTSILKQLPEVDVIVA